METDARRSDRLRNRVRRRVREHIPAATAFLTVVSLALVFGAVGGYAPALPRVDPLVGVVPHANALISATAIATILTGVRAIRRGNVTRHRRAMLASTALFGLFLVLYLYRVSLEGPTEFAGPDTLRRFVYLPMLAVHILLAMVCLPAVYGALLLAGTHRVAELRETPHRRVGSVAATLWLVSFSLGICVYLMLHVLF
jgi:putative membrane protein